MKAQHLRLQGKDLDTEVLFGITLLLILPVPVKLFVLFVDQSINIQITHQI